MLDWLSNMAGRLLGASGKSSTTTPSKAEADRLLELGNRQYSKSQFRAALQAWQLALTLYREFGDRLGEGNSLGNLGLAYDSLGQYQQAIDYHQQSLTIAQEIGDRLGEGKSLGNLGNAYRSLGQYQQAIAYHQQHLTIARELGNRIGEGNSLGNLGSDYHFLGKYQQAIDYHQQSLTIAREIGDRSGEGNSLGNLGSDYHFLGKYQQAIDYHQQSLTIAREIGDRSGEGNSLGNLGSAYRSLGQYQQAIAYHQQSLTIAREIGNRIGEGNSLMGLGIAYRSLGQYQQAIDYYQQSLTIQRELGDRLGEGISLGSLGNAYRSLGQYQQAIDYYQQSLTIQRELGNRSGEGTSLGNLGNVYCSLGQYQQAIDYYQQSLTIARELGNRSGEGNSLGHLGNAYDSLGQYQQAIDYYQQSLTIARELGERSGEGNSLGNLGSAYHCLGQYQQAIDYYQQSLTIARELGERSGEGISLRGLGNAYHCLGQYQQAIDYYQQSLTIARELGERSGEGNSLGNLGSAYHCLGQYQQAIDYHQQSLTIARELGERSGEGISLRGLGNAYHCLGQYQQAIDYYQQSLTIARELGERSGEGNSLMNLGLAYNCLGQSQQAIDYHQQSLTIARELGDRSGEGRSLGNLGLDYNCLGQYQQAIDYYQQSLTIARELGERSGEGNSLGNLGSAYHCLGQSQQAIDYYQQSLTIAREIGDRLGEWISLNNLGNVFLNTNQLAEAEETLSAAIEICETLRSGLINDDHKVSIFETQARTYRLLQQVLVAQGKFDTALEIAERGRTRAFVELLRERLSADVVAEVADKLKVGLTDNPSATSTPLVKGGKGGSKPAAQIAQEQNATIVEYSIVSEGIYIWVIQPTGEITFRRGNLEPLQQQNKTLSDLEKIILKARVSIGVDERNKGGSKIECEPDYKRDRSGRFPLLQLLYQILISPIADLLPTDADAHIIFIPHYALFLVPFTALQNANNQYLIEHHTLLTAPSIEVLDLTHQQQQHIQRLKQTALVVGDPIIAEKFTQAPYNLKPIPAAKEAAQIIATLLQTEAITGEKATKAFIIEQMLAVQLLHISAHGLLDNFGGSGIPGTIILAPSETDDGALNAAEILTLKLNTELAVLSACSTGKGKITGDGVIGLSRCFILAGVPSVIVSLWNMGALSAKLLMTEFYQNLAQGQDRAAALRQAMLSTKAKFSRPADWAAFTLIGETEPLSLQTQTVKQRKLTMPFSSENTPDEIKEAFFNLLETSDVFSQHLQSLDELYAQPTDRAKEIAQKIEQWCETRPDIKEYMENELGKMGAGGTSSTPDENVAQNFNERLQQNRMRLSSPSSSSSTKNNP